ncbi:hypothetical protein L208DRAFT_1308978 [Tricholoma matsutake]|nr:hypothetical protein L208DRAFT_1308978 [Tricholoma matsutake 945]
MDTRKRSVSPQVKKEQTPPPQKNKISAYYSLVFPHFTFYIQTLSVTIGRRCAHNPNVATSSTAEPLTVDVDLGALKSVSRLHAKIEFDQEEDRFVLAVIGRNGAWVDGIWSGAGTRAPLGERSQIQIASRTFHFVLPPPPPPEDTPSPSSQSSTNLPRSPSLDITSISPPSSQPSHTPPPSEHKVSASPPELSIPDPPPKPKPVIVTNSQLPNSNLIGKSNKTANARKRKKGDDDTVYPRPKPEDMPPKPPFTYAQLIYRAIKAIGDKATLQEICSWIMNTYEYYRYAEAGWTSSVRHNLSSSRAFLKLERCGGDRGKGFFWTLDEKHSQLLEEQEAKILQAAATGSQGGKDGFARGRKKDKVLLEPALKRSVKGDLKGGPLPPPLTSSPLMFKMPSTSSTATAACDASPNISRGTTAPGTSGVFAYPIHPHPSHVGTIPSRNTSSSGTQNPYASLTQNWALHSIPPLGLVNTTLLSPPVAATSSTSSSGPSTQPPGQVPQPSPTPAGVPDVIIPIILGPIPLTHPEFSPTHPNNSVKEGYMVVHDKKLILDPVIFAGLAKEKLEELEKMGTRAALPILTEHMVKVLKRRRAKERGKGRKRGTGKRDENGGGVGDLFTTAPLEPGKAASGATDSEARLDTNSTGVGDMERAAQATPPEHVAIPDPVPVPMQQEDIGSPIVIVDDTDDEGPSAKRRKVGNDII